MDKDCNCQACQYEKEFAKQVKSLSGKKKEFFTDMFTELVNSSVYIQELEDEIEILECTNESQEPNEKGDIIDRMLEKTYFYYQEPVTTLN